jgi:hypothetical protein
LPPDATTELPVVEVVALDVGPSLDLVIISPP